MFDSGTAGSAETVVFKPFDATDPVTSAAGAAGAAVAFDAS
jgi:hypothetical protein